MSVARAEASPREAVAGSIPLSLLPPVTSGEATAEAAPSLVEPACPNAQLLLAGLLKCKPKDLPADLTQAQAEAFAQHVTDAYVRHTDFGKPGQRQREITLFVQGKTSAEIAQEFGSQLKTVQSGRRNVVAAVHKKFGIEQVQEEFQRLLQGEEALHLKALTESVPRKRNPRTTAPLVQRPEKPAETPSAPSKVATESEEDDDDIEALEANAPAEDAVRLYLKAIGKTPLLKAVQEVELSRQIEAGLYAAHQLAENDAEWLKETAARYYPRSSEKQAVDRLKADLGRLALEGAQAKQHMLESNLRLVVSLAKRYQGRGLEFLDLIQEGNLGLVRAVEKFDYTKGFKFSTYATWWIRQAITRGIADQGRTIRLPVHLGEQLSKLNRLERLFRQENGRDASPEELATDMDMSVEKILELYDLSRKPVSLETPITEGEDSVLGDFVADGDTEVVEEAVVFTAMQDEVRAAVDTLEEREKRIIIMRYGLDDGNPKTLSEVAGFFHLTRERIRQIERDAMIKLRHPARSQHLREYW